MRVIVLDYSASRLAPGELGWLQSQLASAKQAAEPAIVMGSADLLEGDGGAVRRRIELARPELHLAGLLIVCIAAALISTSAVLSSVLQSQRLDLHRLLRGEQPVQLEPGEAKKLLQSIQE